MAMLWEVGDRETGRQEAVRGCCNSTNVEFWGKIGDLENKPSQWTLSTFR